MFNYGKAKVREEESGGVGETMVGRQRSQRKR